MKKLPKLWRVQLMCLENGAPKTFYVYVEEKDAKLLAKVLSLKKVSTV